VTDYIGHSYTVLNGTGICYVPAGYYKLTATPKTAYQYWYGSLPCIHDWIGITATNTSISNVMASIRQQTASYLISAGGDSRLVVTFSDAVTGHTYNYYLIKDDGSIVFSAITNNPVGFVKNPIDYGCYYGIIVNTWHSCTALLPLTCINQQLQQWFNLSGVKRVFLTPYSTNITWQNWKTSDEDYYVAGIDPLTFAGTKIKSFSGITGWYKLPTNADTTYTAPIDKVRQGFMYTHTLTLTFGQSDYVKWMDLYQLLLLTNRYIVVFEDNNDEWFCFGYQNVGGRTYVYQQIMETNTFMIQIKFFGSFMLTSLDKNYCINHILN
jgi:hypothetical protein